MVEARPPQVTEVHRAYHHGFVAAMAICFSPFKSVAYVVPLLFLAWMLLTTRGAISRDKLFGVTVVIVGGAAFYDLVAPEFLLTNYALAVVTYSAVFPVLLIESRTLASRWLLEKQLGLTAAMLGFQGVVGIIQGVYGALVSGSFGGDNGDRVAGTIYPYLHPERAFSNPMFAVNLAVMLLVTLSVPALASRRRGSLLLAMTALILASVVHVLVFLVAALVIAMVITRPRKVSSARRSPRRHLLAVLVILGGLSYVALPSNVANITRVAETALDLDAVGVPRAILLGRVITELPSEAPWQPLIGLGPGQFSSRASLIASGLYLGGVDSPRALPFLSPSATQLADDYCFTLLAMMVDTKEIIGSSEQPFFSFLSVYTEVGAIGLVLLLLVGVGVLRRIQRRARERPEVWLHALLLTAGIVFLGMLGMQENYWEAPQAIFVGILLLKVLHANVMYGGDDAT